jgi:hypothetical protein
MKPSGWWWENSMNTKFPGRGPDARNFRRGHGLEPRPASGVATGDARNFPAHLGAVDLVPAEQHGRQILNGLQQGVADVVELTGLGLGGGGEQAGVVVVAGEGTGVRRQAGLDEGLVQPAARLL